MNMILVASFVSILHGKSKISSTSFHQWKYMLKYLKVTLDIAKIIKIGSVYCLQQMVVE